MSLTLPKVPSLPVIVQTRSSPAKLFRVSASAPPSSCAATPSAPMLKVSLPEPALIGALIVLFILNSSAPPPPATEPVTSALNVKASTPLPPSKLAKLLNVIGAAPPTATDPELSVETDQIESSVALAWRTRLPLLPVTVSKPFRPPTPKPTVATVSMLTPT